MKSFYEYTRNILNEKSDEKNPFFNYDEDGDKVGLNVDKLNSIELEDGKLIYDGKPIKDKYLIEIRKDSSYNAWKKKNKDNKKDIISSISKIKEQTTDRYEYKIAKNDKLAFDHARVIAAGMARLKNKITYTDIVFNMMGEYFTLGELQQVYEVILGKKLLDPAFRRIIADKVVKTDKMQTGEGHRPSVLFKYKNK